MKKVMSMLMIGVLLFQNLSPLYAYNYSAEDLIAGLERNLAKIGISSPETKEIILYGETEEIVVPSGSDEREVPSGMEGNEVNNTDEGESTSESSSIITIPSDEQEVSSGIEGNEVEDLDEKESEENTTSEDFLVDQNDELSGNNENISSGEDSSQSEEGVLEEQIAFQTLDIGIMSLNPSDIDLIAEITAANQTVKIRKYFTNAYTVDRGDGSAIQNLTSDTIHTYTTVGNYTITLALTGGATRWKFQTTRDPLVPKNGTTASNIYVSTMPDLINYFGDSPTSLGHAFFNSFNYQGALTSFPVGSFDTFNISGTVGNNFFALFNFNGSLTSLPDGSFDISNITTVGENFFYGFNEESLVTQLPVNSFDTSNIESVKTGFFKAFNKKGKLTTLPEGSFNMNKITVADEYFFFEFNREGDLTSLPEGSFNTSNITSVGKEFFCIFNENGKITTLPDSFKRPALDATNASKQSNFLRSFNSPNYTLNKSADLIVNGGATPNSDRDTFSDNQPGRCFVDNNWLVNVPNNCPSPSNIQLTAEISAVNQTVKINKYFSNSYIVDRGDGSAIQNITSDTTHTYSSTGEYTITLFMTSGTKWNFTSNTKPFIPRSGTTASNIYISVMPNLADYFGASATSPGNYFFYYFNYNGALTSLPIGSFDTSNITTAGNYFFSYFNEHGNLTSLPVGSFNTSNITSVGNDFFLSFNYNGDLTSLPVGSFNTSNVTSVGNNFFLSFNYHGNLTSLPIGSFNTSNITSVGNYFFHNFNYNGDLTSLPDGSFDTSNITSVGNYFFSYFNNNGALTDLPDSFTWPVLDSTNASKSQNFYFAFNSPNYTLNRSADLIINGGATPNTDRNTFSNNQPGICNIDYNWVVNIPNNCLKPSDIKLTAEVSAANQTVRINKYFNNTYAVDRGDGSAVQNLTSDTIHTYTTTGSYTITLTMATETKWTFKSNYYYPLVPKGGTTANNVFISVMPNLADYFGTSATSPGDYFFYYFNSNGALTSLPNGSFDTSNVTSAGNYFFSYFNNNGNITSLPVGSFDTANISSVGNNFFSYFSYNGVLTDLPDSFRWPALDITNMSKSQNFYFAFNSPNYTLNKSADLIINGGTTPNTDRNTFSNNQPGICNIDYNWVVNIPNNCLRPSDIKLTAEISAANQTVRINKYFNNSYAVDRGDGSTPTNLTSDTTHTYTTTGNYTITLIMTSGTRWTFKSNYYYPLVPKGGTTADNVFISSIPDLAYYFGTSATSPGDYFFYYFNSNGALTSLPAGSFDTSNITTVGNYFFYAFNTNGSLTSLPERSFDTSNISSVGDTFFYYFNTNGSLASLPVGSFNTSNITSVGNNFFSYFNHNGALTDLPDSFIRPALDSTNANKPQNFYSAFNSPNYTLNRDVASIINGIATPNSDRNTFSDNQLGRCLVDDNWLVNVPTNCSRPSNIQLIAEITADNQTVKLNKYFTNSYTVDRGDGSMGQNMTSNITHTYTTTGDYTITLALAGGATRWKFQQTWDPLVPRDGTTASNIYVSSMPDLTDYFGDSPTSPGNAFFNSFNHRGALTSFPMGSFDTSNISGTVGNNFFALFNFNGSLIELPEGSFNIVNISDVGEDFFYGFVEESSITELPEGSFDTSNIKTMKTGFFKSFNKNGKLISLPEGSFNTDKITVADEFFFFSFNYGGDLESLPEGSFNTSNITTAGKEFFCIFNRNGKITHLPDSFKWPALSEEDASKRSTFYNSFNSPNYTLNKDISDIINGSSTPNVDRDTFSDNQPGRCLVDDNWLVNVPTNCVPPTIISIDIYPSTPTSGDVVLTITATGTTSLEYSFDNTLTRQTQASSTFTDNITGLVLWVRDMHNNQVSTGYDITNIDRVAPLVTVKGSPTLEINQGDHYVELGAIWTDNFDGSGELLSPTKGIVNSNKVGNYVVEYSYTDRAGNIGIATRTIEVNKVSTGGGGGSIKQKDHCPNGDFSPSYYDNECGMTITDGEHGSAEENIEESQPGKNEFEAREDIYERAKKYQLTDANSLEDMRLDKDITRAEMAEIITRYSESFLRKTPDTTKQNCRTFSDLNSAPDSLQKYVVSVCQLGLMGYYSDGETQKETFTPNEVISRAEVATTISRMLRGNENKGSEERWYHNHLLALRKKDIIQKDIDPMTKELRENVFLMLSRA